MSSTESDAEVNLTVPPPDNTTPHAQTMPTQEEEARLQDEPGVLGAAAKFQDLLESDISSEDSEDADEDDGSATTTQPPKIDGGHAGTKNFSLIEWYHLFKAYIATSEDATKGTDRKASTFWMEIEKKYAYIMAKYTKKNRAHAVYFAMRTHAQLNSQFSNCLQPQLNKFLGKKKRLGKVSGADHKQIYEKVEKLYKDDPKTKQLGKLKLYDFDGPPLLGANQWPINILALAEKHPKWETYVSEQIVPASGPSSGGEEESKPKKRSHPPGAKAAMAKKKAKAILAAGNKKQKAMEIVTVDLLSSDSDGEKEGDNKEVNFMGTTAKAMNGVTKVVQGHSHYQKEKSDKRFILEQQRMMKDLMQQFSGMSEMDKDLFYPAVQGMMNQVTIHLNPVVNTGGLGAGTVTSTEIVTVTPNQPSQMTPVALFPAMNVPSPAKSGPNKTGV